MFLFYIVFTWLTDVYISEGRIFRCIIGGNVSFSWTFNNIKKDVIIIHHRSSPFLRVWPLKNRVILHKQDDRLRINVDNFNSSSVNVTIDIMNVTENDAGIYKVERQKDSVELNDSVIVQTFDERTIPRIAMLRHSSSDSFIILKCSSSSASTINATWKLNGSLIENQSRYSQNSTFLTIINITANDKYNIYSCEEFGSGFDSDPYRLNIYGPTVINFAPNFTLVKEHEDLNASCLADCYPICTWNWTKLDLSMGQERIIPATEKQLQLKNITRKEAGRYSCNVHNLITGASLEGFTYLNVVYGPDEIVFNTSDNAIQLNPSETVAIVCSADCFPSCQIIWSDINKETMIPNSELSLASVIVDVNYTCRATNPMMDNAMLSKTIYIQVKPGNNHYTTMTSMPPKHTETDDFPSARHMLYVAVGIGAALAFSLLACLHHKIKTCLRVDRSSTSNPLSDSNTDGRVENRQEEKPSANYWTIVSYEKGKLSTALETNSKHCRMSIPAGTRKATVHNKSEEIINVTDINVYLELDEDMDLIHSGAANDDDYINPVHYDPVNTDSHHITEL